MNDIKEINVEEIMEEIRKNIAERNIDYEPVSFDDVKAGVYFDAVDLDSKVALANSTCDISQTYLPYTGNFIVRFFKKIVRRILIVFAYRQNMFNSYVTSSLNQINNYIKDKNINGDDGLSMDKINKYFEEHEALEEAMNSKIIVLEKKIEELEKIVAEKE